LRLKILKKLRSASLNLKFTGSYKQVYQEFVIGKIVSNFDSDSSTVIFDSIWDKTV